MLVFSYQGSNLFTLMLLSVVEITVKLLNFQMQEKFAVIHLKFKLRGQTVRVFRQNGANGIANSEDPDQNAPLGAV